MILAVDVQYHDDAGFTAGLLFERWDAAASSGQYTTCYAGVGEYIPGEFYRRELPCILSLLADLAQLPACIVIDGFVFLDGHAKPGLGKHLYDALQGKVNVIGVAKTSFAGIGDEHKLLRGTSEKPLYITCIGGDTLSQAKQHIASMQGPHRIPTLLKTVDQMCRKQAGDAMMAAANAIEAPPLTQPQD